MRDFAKAFYLSKEWRRARAYVFNRDAGLCVRCGELGEIVHHKEHLTPRNIGDPGIALGEDNLELLCRNCHALAHAGELAIDSGLMFDDEPDPDSPYYFDEEIGERPIIFAERFCKQSQGVIGAPLVLELFQKAYIQALFGFLEKETGFRRYRETMFLVGRKNGKSTLLAAIALYMLIADYEGAAEIYSVATKKDQAKKVLTEAINMVKQSPELRAVLKKRRNDLYFAATASIFEALASDSNTLDGLNSHAVIIDELHAIKDRNWYFADPINQRGQTEYTSAGYTIDRWSIEAGAKLKVLEDGVVFTPNPSKYNLFVQAIENYKDLIGKQLTLSVLIEENTCTNCVLWLYGGTADNLVITTMNGNDKLYSVTMTPKSNITSLRCGFQGRNSAGSVKILAVKLELGDQQTLAHQDASGSWVLNDPPPNKAQELLKCMRYQIAFDWYQENFVAGYGETTSTTTANAFLPILTPMRTTPTISNTDGSNWACKVIGTPVKITSISVWFASKNLIGMRLSGDFPIITRKEG